MLDAALEKEALALLDAALEQPAERSTHGWPNAAAAVKRCCGACAGWSTRTRRLDAVRSSATRPPRPSRLGEQRGSQRGCRVRR
jgi:hypothetical protein